jgi:hypothetical protein
MLPAAGAGVYLDADRPAERRVRSTRVAAITFR